MLLGRGTGGRDRSLFQEKENKEEEEEEEEEEKRKEKWMTRMNRSRSLFRSSNGISRRLTFYVQLSD